MPLDSLCEEYGLPFELTPEINCTRTVELFRMAKADLGLSLGNGYIASRIFTLPARGMLNVHHELLPAFRGARSVIWQIYQGSRITGYTIHQINKRIDQGDILYQRKIPIDFKDTLRETVIANCARLYKESAIALPAVVSSYMELAARATPQEDGCSYTTPTFREYRRMVRQHRELFQKYVRDADPMR